MKSFPSVAPSDFVGSHQGRWPRRTPRPALARDPCPLPGHVLPCGVLPGEPSGFAKSLRPPPPITSTARLDPELHPPLAPDRATACVTFGSCARAQKSVSTDQVACEGTLVPGFARPDSSKRSRRNGFASPSDSTPSQNHAVLQKGSRGRTRLPHPALRREALTLPLPHLSTVKEKSRLLFEGTFNKDGCEGLLKARQTPRLALLLCFSMLQFRDPLIRQTQSL